MDDDKIKINKIEGDLDDIPSERKEYSSDFYSETVFDFPDTDPMPDYIDNPSDDIDHPDFIDDEESPYNSGYTEETNEFTDYEKDEKERFQEQYTNDKNKETVEKNESDEIDNDQPEEKPEEKPEEPKVSNEPNNNPENLDKPDLEEKPGLGDKPDLEDKPGLGENPNLQLNDSLGNPKDAADKMPTGDIPNLGDKGNLIDNLPIGGGSKQPQPEEQPEQKSEEEKTLSDMRKEREDRNTKNNADNLRNAADVAIATHDPTATAIGTVVKKADELTGGESTKLLGKALTYNNRFNPAGKQMQRSLNAINESGLGDKLGQAASMMNSASGDPGSSAAKGSTPPSSSAPKPSQPQNNKPEPKQKKPEPKKEKSSSNDNKSGSSKSEKSIINDNPLLDSETGDVIKYLLNHPYIIITIIVLIFAFFLILFEDSDIKGDSKNSCTYELNGITSEGNIILKRMKVELINCNGTESNYSVLETVDFEKYVLGVALAEADEDASAEELKARIVIARNMALTRNKELCPSNNNNCFYGYNVNNGYIRLRACELDKKYWDYEKDSFVEYNDNNNLYSPEISEGTEWKKALDSTKKKEILSIAEEVKGKVLLDNNGNVMQVSNNPLVLNDEDKAKTYTEILESKYGSSNYNTNSVCK